KVRPCDRCHGILPDGRRIPEGAGCLAGKSAGSGGARIRRRARSARPARRSERRGGRGRGARRHGLAVPFHGTRVFRVASRWPGRPRAWHTEAMSRGRRVSWLSLLPVGLLALAGAFAQAAEIYAPQTLDHYFRLEWSKDGRSVNG